MKIGIIGGSGLEKGDILQDIEIIEIKTPYGNSKVKKGLLCNEEVYIISRHGENHEITPTNVNNRANIYVLGKIGCDYILATTAVGSLKEEIKPGDFVIADQFIDFTKHRKTTFFEDFTKGIQHTSLAEPFSKELRKCLINSCTELGFKYHNKGTIITIEGPRFSTRAESNMFRQFADVINMSTAPEAILAKEAGIEYAAIAMSTDYDCWKETEKPVTWEEIKEVMKQNSENVKKVLIKTIQNLSQTKENLELGKIKDKIRTIPNYPKQGIMFRDITTLIGNKGMKQVIDILYDRYKDIQIDGVAGMEARGFIFGGALADRLNCNFIPIRKKGKLPHKTISQEYALEYGTDCVEVHEDAIKPGQNILLVDDLIATGGTAKAGCELIKKLKGNIKECVFVIDLPELGGKKRLIDAGYKVFSLIEFEGE